MHGQVNHLALDQSIIELQESYKIFYVINLNHASVDYKVTEKSFNFPKKYGLPFYFVSAADGTNVVKV